MKVRHILTVIGLIGGLGSVAEAQTSIAGTSNKDLIVLGAANVSGTNYFYSCLNGTATQHEVLNLDNNYVVNAGAETDRIVILRASETYTCPDGANPDVSMSALTTTHFASQYIDVNGQDGDDEIAGGDGDGILDGGADLDRVTVRSNTTVTANDAEARGGLANDTVGSAIVGTSERLDGDAGNDCLERLAANTGAPALFFGDSHTTGDMCEDVTGGVESGCETLFNPVFDGDCGSQSVGNGDVYVPAFPLSAP
jgi:hypothetical protein